MNTRENMIIVKGKIQTQDIRYCNYDNTIKKWKITYNSGSSYDYNYANVIWLREPKIYTPCMYRISKDGVTFNNMKVIYVFTHNNHKYWHICFENGCEKDYRQEELTIVESCLNNKDSKNVFEYIRKIADLSTLKNEETDEKILPKQFDKISIVGTDVVLANYLTGSTYPTSKSNKGIVPIFPFGCNNSQYKAVKNAMENKISVIQGPPGTGKTQTILNIIANILIQGKTVQVNRNAIQETDKKVYFVKRDFQADDEEKKLPKVYF